MTDNTPVTRSEVKALLAMLPGAEEFRKQQPQLVVKSGEMPNFGWSLSIERDNSGVLVAIYCRPFPL